MTTAQQQIWIGESKYVFRVSLRVVHWVIFLAIIVLSGTGYWIGSADLPGGPGGVAQVSEVGPMGWTRYVHTVTAWVLVSALLVRLYLFFAGNEYARWPDFVPTRKEHWRDMKDVFRYYTFFESHYPHADFGHNRLAALTYLVVYLLLLFMVVSGFALHGLGFTTGWQSWMTWPLAFVSIPTMRLLHHMGMWLLWGFAVHHIASAVLVDHETRGGLMGGIFSGYKIVPKRAK